MDWFFYFSTLSEHSKRFKGKIIIIEGDFHIISTSHPVCFLIHLLSPFSFNLTADQSAPDRREELGQREAGAAGEIQPGESSVGAATERGHCAAGEGMMGGLVLGREMSKLIL